jgi:hypothetical protein
MYDGSYNVVLYSHTEADGKVFLQPVDEAYAPVCALYLSLLLIDVFKGYRQLISHPMDLGTIQQKILTGQYTTAWDYLV